MERINEYNKYKFNNGEDKMKIEDKVLKEVLRGKYAKEYPDIIADFNKDFIAFGREAIRLTFMEVRKEMHYVLAYGLKQDLSEKEIKKKRLEWMKMKDKIPSFKIHYECHKELEAKIIKQRKEIKSKI